jgi:hypothetical protein
MKKTIVVGSIILGLGISVFTQHNQLTPEEEEEGWQLLFDGTYNGPNSMAQHWVNYEKNNPNTTALSSTWQVNEQTGEMFLTGSTGDIRTKSKFKDFHLKFDYKINGNQGFMYRATLCGGSSPASAVEIAMDNNYDSPKHSPGDAYDLYASAVHNFHYFNDPDPWNVFELVAVGDSVEHRQNGEYLLGFRYWSADFIAAYNESKWTGFPCFCRPYDVETREITNSGHVEEGYLAIQGDHGGDLYIRNFKILNLVPGCTDSMYEEYNPEANWSDPGACITQKQGCQDPDYLEYGTVQPCATLSVLAPGDGRGATDSQLVISITDPGQHALRIFDIHGNSTVVKNGTGEKHYVTELKSGIYFIQVTTRKSSAVKRVVVF